MLLIATRMSPCTFKRFLDFVLTDMMIRKASIDYLHSQLITQSRPLLLSKFTKHLQQRIHSDMKGSEHDSFPLLYDRFNSELFTETNEMWNPLVYILSSESSIRRQNQRQYLVHSTNNYYKLVNTNRLQLVLMQRI